MLALNILLSMKTNEFNNKEIKTYEQGSEFLNSLYKLLPNIPQLEDYIPEQDWGEVKVLWDKSIYKIFYGGAIERIYDYIKAFELCYSEYPNILKQMENILILQNSFLSEMNANDFIFNQEFSPGYIEIPSEKFWSICRQKLINTNELFQKLMPDIDSSFIKNIGDIKSINSTNELANTIMEGVALPAIGIRIENNIYPLSFRGMVNVIIEYCSSIHTTVEFSDALSKFISQRFDNIIEEPFLLRQEQKTLPYKFSGLLQENNKIFLFILFDIKTPEKLKHLAKEVYQCLANGRWDLKTIYSPHRISIQNTLGKKPTIDDIEFIFVSSNVSTSMYFFEPPELKCKHHIFSLTEFIALFDSINNIDELSSFLSYLEKYNKKISPFSSVIDKFASFRGSHSVLEDGAIGFNMISLDPHWGSNWRYDELKKYWSQAPLNFPDIDVKWDIRDNYQGNVSLISKRHFYISWTTQINNCTIHFCANCEPLINEDHLNGQLLTLFLECICDALSQRKDILENISFLGIEKISVYCSVDNEYLVSSELDIIENTSHELFSHTSLISSNTSSAIIDLSVNLPLIQNRLNKPKDASFQADICIVFLKLLSNILHIKFPESVENQINNTRNNAPRMAISSEERPFDTLEIKPKTPEPKHFKLARKTLAGRIKDTGIKEGIYELQAAKDIINSLADFFREKIHAQISSLHRDSLLCFVLENYDAYVAEDQRKKNNIILSLQHEVNYDRAEKLAKQSTEFNRISSNYRYLLECTLSLNSKNEKIPTNNEILQLIADIDWLMVLYNFSDILHNDIDVGGVIIDNLYIPQVFFSEDRELKENKFSEEQANYKLGYNLNENDEVEPNIINDKLDSLDRVFLQDLDFKYSNLLAVFSILFQWSRINHSQISLSYQTTKAELIKVILNNCINLAEEEANRIVDFLILDPNKIRKLLGSEINSFDVPISDHNKRAHRYNIRPLIELNNGNIIWGAAAAYRAGTIWISHIANGYLPAEFEWSHISHEVRQIKEQIEKQLEMMTFNIVKRFATRLEQGIDFKKRFPNENFPTVGDFDTLAYFPEKNTWLNIECKYNQPYYCIKDMRRLREKIFGRGDKRGQIGEIENRMKFLMLNQDKLRSLLNWNQPSTDCQEKVINLYISRQIYWWLRNPPYETDINFIQVDALESWLQQNLK
ncbi:MULTISPECIES: hypothetical protein [Limnobaculum]|uniref:hypothetical protein n=1 Tax=Limnobaculum TaxID=2172100 RepID=UPI001E61BE4B|nr:MULTISPECIES: hypothetical protein [Limnobaculum]